MITAALVFLKGVPMWAWVALALVGGALYYGHTRYEAGELSVQTKWDESVARGKAEVERIKAESGKVTVRVETKYVDRVKTIREKADVIVREVTKYVPVGSCDLPGGWRLLHDAAAENLVPDAARIPDAVAVSAQDAAATVAANYGTCHENAARLESLQEWAREQQRVNP